MVLLHTPVCDFNANAIDFTLQDAQGKTYRLADCRGPKGLLVMFICNHCPYVKSVLPDLVKATKQLIDMGVGCVAINANDPTEYPEDSPAHMKVLAEKMHFSFPYLIDQTQETAKAYGAVCTPDFFGYNQDLKLQYRGRFAELLSAMQQIAQTGKGPEDQTPSMGCSIKWR